MPELPEVEITARRIGAAISGARWSRCSPRHQCAEELRSSALGARGRDGRGIRRRGKLFLVDFGEDFTALIHLMSAGRLQLFEARASLRDRTSRLLVRLADGRELRLREFGTRQRAWVKLLRAAELASEETLAALGPEAWPEPPPNLAALLNEPRPLYTLLRDQHVIAGNRPLLVRRDPAHRASSPRSSAATTSTRMRRHDCERRSASGSTARSSITSRSSRCRSPTSCRCRSPCTATRASRARGAGTGWRPCSTRTT